MSTLCFLSRFRPAHGRDRASARKGNRNTMRYYDYISQFAGAEHPFGDLAIDIKAEVESNGEPDELLDIYEGDSFSDIYDHLNMRGACKECVNTFVQSWAAYLKAEKKAINNPVPALILYQLSQLNKGLEHLHWLDQLEDMNCSLDDLNESMGDIQSLLFDVVEYRQDRNGKEYGYVQIGGTVDTYEQN